MRLAQKHILLFALLLVILSASLAAAVEASYEEKLDTTIYDSTYFGVQNLGFSVALHVGTLKIEPTGNGNIPSLYSLKIKRSGPFGGGVEYWLTSSEMINWQNRFGAQLLAKVQFGSTTIVKPLHWATGEGPLTNGETISPSNYPVIIEFYLGIRNINNAGQTDGVGFQFEDDDGNGNDGPNLGNFTIEYRDNPWWGQYETIPFGSSTSAKPFFATNYNEDSPFFLNGNAMDTTVYVSLAIEQAPSEKSIDLLDASGQSRAKVGQTRLTLTGYNSGSIPGVSISFTDGNGSTGNNFRLKHNGIPSFIPFSLYLGGTKVNNGTPMIWDTLSFGDGNLKDLHVGNINYQSAISRMGGSYSNTITVNITSLDGNLVGH